MGASCSCSVSPKTRSPSLVNSIQDDPSQKITSFCISIDQKHIIHETWDMIKDKKEFGLKVFFRIFSIDPVIKTLFGFDNCKTEGELLLSSRFVSHASNFVSFLNMVVGHLNGNEYVGMKACKAIGRKHLKFSTTYRPFDSMYWKTFAEALLIEMEIELKSQCQNQKFANIAILAWCDLFEKIVKIMETAYVDGKLKDS